VRSVIDEGEFSYKCVNYEDQSLDPDSFYNWLVRAIRVRTTCPEFGESKAEFIDMGDSRILAHHCQTDHGQVFALHNLAEEEISVSLKGTFGEIDRAIDLMGEKSQHAEEDLDSVTLSEYGYRWLRIIHPH